MLKMCMKKVNYRTLKGDGDRRERDELNRYMWLDRGSTAGRGRV